MSQFRVEKRRAGAEITLATGGAVRGAFFLAASSAKHVGPERIGDLLNAETGFFPFETGPGDDGTLLVNRAHVLAVRLLDRADEPQHDPGYGIATARHVSMLLTDGTTLTGTVRVYLPEGRDRLSDYARSTDSFRYLESADATYVVNSAHIVSIYETH
ncbi:MAG TPA: hypothetical protein VFB07_11890 [Vicinamibacterales bacterium]|nr:hypothetical protein [Vicinamibacterales bacterium]